MEPRVVLNDLHEEGQQIVNVILAQRLAQACLIDLVFVIKLHLFDEVALMALSEVLFNGTDHRLGNQQFDILRSLRFLNSQFELLLAELRDNLYLNRLFCHFLSSKFDYI